MIIYYTKSSRRIILSVRQKEGIERITIMKKGFERALILSLSIAVVLLITAGCQEQTTTTQKGTIKAADKASKQVVIKTEAKQTSETKAKTTGAENIELKRELAKKDMEIEALKAELARCEEEKADAKKEGDATGKETIKMFEENIQLQTKIEELQKQIEELKAGNKPKAEISG
jgi:predicted RNase H-like nuclease (RuvC/YqgF family)